MLSFKITVPIGQPERHRWAGERAEWSRALAVRVEDSGFVSAPKWWLNYLDLEF